MSLKTQCGTPGYVAPEILSTQPYGKAVDMWSIGVITYILLGGYPPFHDDNQKVLFAKIKNGEFEFHPEYWNAVSDEAKDLISRLLKTNPLERFTAEEALRHSWVSSSVVMWCNVTLWCHARCWDVIIYSGVKYSLLQYTCVCTIF